MNRPNLIPSLANWQIGGALSAFWENLETPGKARLVAYLLLPTFSRIAFIAGFAVTMHGFVVVNRAPEVPGNVWFYGIMIPAVLLLATVLQYAQQSTLKHLKEDMQALLRRVLCRELKRIGESRATGMELRPVSADVEAEKQFTKQIPQCLLSALEFVSGAVLSLLILVAITAAMPVAGVLMVVIGLALLAAFRLRVKQSMAAKKPGPKGAPAARAKLVASLLGGSADEDAAHDYEFGDGPGGDREKQAEKADPAGMTAVSTAASSVVVAVCFILVATTGLRTRDPVHLLIFVVAVRLFAMQGKQLLKHWTEILRRKKVFLSFIMILTGRDGFAKLATTGPGGAPSALVPGSSPRRESRLLR